MKQGHALHPYPPSPFLYKSHVKWEVQKPRWSRVLNTQDVVQKHLDVKNEQGNSDDFWYLLVQQKKNLMHFSWSYWVILTSKTDSVNVVGPPWIYWRK